MNKKNDIVFKNVDKSFGKVEVIKNLNLHIPEGERLVLLGPSGCGKTTILRMIAGFESVTSGELYLAGELVNDVAPGDRNISMVFQNYALFPHMTVGENISFGMEVAKLPKAEQETRMNEALDMLGLQDYVDRYPRELSGGQRQRVALARAIVKQSPYFLLDEPLSNLDAKLRTYARAELVKIHEVYKPTFIYVTHDQVEAMTMGQRIALIHNNIIQQLDTPDNIYNSPKNTFVASFIGSPSMNIFNGEIEKDNLIIADQKIKIPNKWFNIVQNKTNVIVGIRPEHIILDDVKGDIKAKIVYSENHGNQIAMTLDIKIKTIMCTLEPGYATTGDEVYVNIDWDKIHFFNSETSENLGYPNEIINDKEMMK